MTNEQINRSVAEELGWASLRERYIWGPSLDGIAPGDSESSRKQVPDFCNDHNAAAEMRKGIKADEEILFAHWLDTVLGAYCTGYDLINATPRQQAEAFLRMRGKWIG